MIRRRFRKPSPACAGNDVVRVRADRVHTRLRQHDSRRDGTYRWTWPKVGGPTILPQREASPAFCREPARTTPAAIPAARHETLADQTHNVAPDVLGAVLVRFFGTG